MSATVFSDAALADASRVIQSSKAYQAGKAELFLNTLGRHAYHYSLWSSVPSARYSPLVLGDRALAASGGEAALTIQDLAGSAAFSIVKEQVSHFVENSKVLVGLLDEVGKAHPFVLSISLLSSLSPLLSGADIYCVVAVSVFKAAITLELNRRDNDQKVITLNVTMCDMMQVMTLSVKYPPPWWCAHTRCSLKNVATPKDQGQDGVTIEQRLQGRMAGIIDSIKACAKLCDSYQKRHTAGKHWSRWPSIGC